jgi:HAD superfamily hydrolase (TIGR01549 family)
MPNSIKNIRAILFDFGGTLDHDGLPWKERFYEIYRSMGFSWSEEEFAPHFYASDDFLTEQTLKRAHYKPMLLRQVRLVLKHAGVKNEEAAQRVSARFYADSFRVLKRNAPILKRLSQKFALGIVSNFYGNLPVLIKEIGYAPYFKVVADSSRVGALKPEAKIFNYALKRLKSSPGETLFVGDSPHRDMAGAKALGLPHLRIVPPNVKVKLCCRQDCKITSLTQLPSLLS